MLVGNITKTLKSKSLRYSQNQHNKPHLAVDPMDFRSECEKKLTSSITNDKGVTLNIEQNIKVKTGVVYKGQAVLRKDDSKINQIRADYY